MQIDVDQKNRVSKLIDPDRRVEAVYEEVAVSQVAQAQDVDLLQRADRVISSSKQLVVQRQLCAAKLHNAALRAEKRSQLKWPCGN